MIQGDILTPISEDGIQSSAVVDLKKKWVDAKIPHLISDIYSKKNKQMSSKIIPFHSSSGGGGMDAPKGVFTTPVDGAYHFAFSGQLDEKNEFLRVRLTVNNEVKASPFGVWNKFAI